MKLRWRPLHVPFVTRRTFAKISALASDASRQRFLLHHAEDPRHLIGVHIQGMGFGIVSRPAPLRAAIETRENNRALPAGWNELSIAAQFQEPAQGFIVRLRSTL